MTLLSVNVNKVAVLRNSRGGRLPDPIEAVRCALAAGCDGITVHPRPDQRHIRPDDVVCISGELGTTELNLEGNPFAPSRGSYPGLLELARRVHPAQVTLVPDGDDQLTSDHGFDFSRHDARLQVLIASFRQEGCRVSLFVDAGAPDLARAAEYGADRIELYTGPYAAAFAENVYSRELEACSATAAEAAALGLGVNAGHDLDQRNLGSLLQAIPSIAEVSIGHALFSESLYMGLAETVRSYLAIIRKPRSNS